MSEAIRFAYYFTSIVTHDAMLDLGWSPWTQKGFWS